LGVLIQAADPIGPVVWVDPIVLARINHIDCRNLIRFEDFDDQ
jgi:hypothetical protein